MKTLTLHNQFQHNSTIVGNDFIDHHMRKANGEYVKVYLLLLRYLNSPDCEVTISSLADCLECTEKDIVRALNYWSNEGLITIHYDLPADCSLDCAQNNAYEICGISLGGSNKSSDKNFDKNFNKDFNKNFDKNFDKSSNTNFNTKTAPDSEQSQPAAHSAVQKNAALPSEADLRQLYFVTEQYIGKPLSASDLQKINYFFEVLHFSTDLIEYLIEYCVDNGHRSMHYIESVALAWSDANITTIAEAKGHSEGYTKNSFAILNSFGIKGRNPAPVELNYMKRWFNEYGFTLDIIIEACSRTIAHTSKPDFKYADSILKNWFAKNVHNMSDIARLDQVYQQNKANGLHKKAVVSKRPAMKAGSATRFNNFESRSYDISSLEQQLLNTP